MAVEDKYVNTNLASGTLLDGKNNGGGSLKVFRVTFETAAADDDGSVYRLIRIPSSAVVKSLTVWNDAITSGTDYDIGLYNINGGAVVDKDLFCDGTTMATARDAVELLTAPDIAEIHKSIWEYAALSLTKDPVKEYDLAITANTVGSAAGTITLDIELLV